VDNLPVPMVVIDADMNVMTGAPRQDTLPGDIVRTACRDWLWWHEQRTLADQRPSWDLVAVHYAVKGSGDFLEFPRLGRLNFDPERGCRRQDGEQFNNHFLVQEKPAIGSEFADYLIDTIARLPVDGVSVNAAERSAGNSARVLIGRWRENR